MKLSKVVKLAQGHSYVTNGYFDYIQHRNIKREAELIQQIQDRPERIREGSWSASATGACLRQRQFTFLGFPRKRVDDRTMNIFANGDFVHLRHQVAGLIEGYISEVEVPVTLPAFRLRGTMDARLNNNAIGEFKSIYHFGFSQVMSFGAKADHVQQVHAYMLCTGLDRAHIVYEDKDTQNIKEFVVQRDPEIIKSVIRDLQALNMATEEKKFLPMLPECRQFKGQFNYCPYAKVCEDAKWPTDS